MSDKYHSIHTPHDIPDLSGAFQITTPPGTDIWDKPPSTHSFSAPLIYRKTKVGNFQSAKVSLSAQWTHRYDQGGLCLVANLPEGRKWIKTGVEFEDDRPNLSTVSKDTWSDWSYIPLKASAATIGLERDQGSVLVHLYKEDGRRQLLRDVTCWADFPIDTECWIGVYVAKPAPHGEKDDLTVDFKDLKIRITD